MNAPTPTTCPECHQPLPLPDADAVCEACGQPYRRRRRAQRFCEAKCRYAAANAKRIGAVVALALLALACGGTPAGEGIGDRGTGGVTLGPLAGPEPEAPELPPGWVPACREPLADLGTGCGVVGRPHPNGGTRSDVWCDEAPGVILCGMCFSNSYDPHDCANYEDRRRYDGRCHVCEGACEWGDGLPFACAPGATCTEDAGDCDGL